MNDYYLGHLVHYDYDGKNNNGYPYICDKNNKYARSNGVVDIHRVQASIILGRDLNDSEVVHHKDENKSNYDLDNLMIFMSVADHTAYHKGQKICLDEDSKTYFCPDLHKIFTNTCIDCGREVCCSSIRCIKCRSLQFRKVERPNRDELKYLIKTKSFVSIGKLYGVSDNTVRKWCISYNLPYKSSDIKCISNRDWDNL